MIVLTKGLLKDSVVAHSSSGDEIELDKEGIIKVLQKYGATFKEASEAVESLLKGEVEQVTVGK